MVQNFYENIFSFNLLLNEIKLQFFGKSDMYNLKIIAQVNFVIVINNYLKYSINE